MANDDTYIREFIVRMLDGEAHIGFDDAVADYPMDRINEQPPNVPYSPWQLLEHIRFTQYDILDFIRNPDYQDRRWPDDYWPGNGKDADAGMWKETVSQYRKDLETLKNMVRDPQTDLSHEIGWGDGQTMFEEFLKVADHTAYHIGEFGILRQAMGTWPKGHR